MAATLFATPALAQYNNITGTVVLPFWSANPNTQAGQVFLTNSGDFPVVITATFYTNTGGTPNCTFVYSGFSNNNTTVEPGKIGQISASCPTQHWGWARISYSRPWNSSAAVYGFGYRAIVNTNVVSEFIMPLNNGDPF